MILAACGDSLYLENVKESVDMGFYATTFENEKAAILPRMAKPPSFHSTNYGEAACIVGLWLAGSAYPRSSRVRYGLRFLSPELARWINRDPVGENGGINIYAYVMNKPTYKSDPVGWLSYDQKMLLCQTVANTAEMTKVVKNLKKRKAFPSPPHVGHPIHDAIIKTIYDQIKCLSKIKCGQCCDIRKRGVYDSFTGNITICVNHDWNDSIDKIKITLNHELVYADSFCRVPPVTCSACMREEKMAYWRSGGCADDKNCTAWAMDSCKSLCIGRSKEQFYGIDDPTGMPPYTSY